MSTGRRELWNGTPVKGGDLFTLHKLRGCRTHHAVCALFSHQFGWELRLAIGEDTVQTQVCRTIQEFMDTADSWKAGLLERGWT